MTDAGRSKYISLHTNLLHTKPKQCTMDSQPLGVPTLSPLLSYQLIQWVSPEFHGGEIRKTGGATMPISARGPGQHHAIVACGSHGVEEVVARCSILLNAEINRRRYARRKVNGLLRTSLQYVGGSGRNISHQPKGDVQLDIFSLTTT